MPELPENGPGTVWFATINVTSVCLTGLSRRGVFISHYALSLCALTLMFYFGCTDERCLTFSHSHTIISTDYLFQTEFIVGEFFTYSHRYLHHISFVHWPEKSGITSHEKCLCYGPSLSCFTARSYFQHFEPWGSCRNLNTSLMWPGSEIHNLYFLCFGT